MVARATPIFKELGLDQAGAQRLVDFYNETIKAENDKGQKLVADRRAAQLAELSKDPDMGGKLETVKADIGAMKDAIFANNPGLRREFEAEMDLTGAGDSRAIVKAWWLASAAFKEGTHVSGSPNRSEPTKPGTPPPTAAQAIYPNLPSSAAQRH